MVYGKRSTAVRESVSRFIVVNLGAEEGIGRVTRDQCLARKVIDLFERYWPAARLIPSDADSLLRDVREECPDLVVIVATASVDVRDVCHAVRDLTSAPLLLVGPQEVAGHLFAGADACVRGTAGLRLVGAYAIALLRRRPPGVVSPLPEPFSEL